jgi:large subunit ribosomal protein L13
MAEAIQRQTKIIDAAGVSVGRIATQAAKYLQGKHRASYQPHIDMGDFVEVVGAAKVKLTGRKLEQKKYYHYSGYPGGMKVTELKTIMAKNPAEAIRRAVLNMLPKNRLQKGRMLRLTVKND